MTHLDNHSIIPTELASSIQEGRCIAFVGAGFSGAANLPTWAALLQKLASHTQIPADVRQHILHRLEEKRSDCHEEAAQLLQNQLGRETFIQGLHEHLCGKSPPERMQGRLNYLHGIPFKAVLTTNFDDLLSGKPPHTDVYRTALHTPPSASKSLYASYLRIRRHGKLHLRQFDDLPTIKLHGDLNAPETVVFSRQDYRRRLYSDPAYLSFLRAVFLNYTILYLGYSFTDAYLNELRSEALSILGNAYERPRAYAVVNDVPELTRKFYIEHEGIEMLTYDSKDGKDHSGFDEWLRALHQATNPIVQFGALLQDKQILWLDPNRDSVKNIADGFFVEAANQAKNTGCQIEPAKDADEAFRKLTAPALPSKFDLVITHWGHQPQLLSTAEQLLISMREKNIRVPVLIFSIRERANERKPIALGLGAQGYYYSNEGLLQAIEHILKPGVETG